MKTAAYGIAALALSLAGTALAQAPAPNPAVNPGSSKVSPVQFSSLDTNKDGRVSRDEVKSHVELTSSFGTLDADHDTYLSETEFGKWNSSSPADGSMSGAARTPQGNSGSPQSGTPGKNTETR